MEGLIFGILWYLTEMSKTRQANSESCLPKRQAEILGFSFLRPVLDIFLLALS